MGTVRFFPAVGELQLDIVNYGFAGSYKMWRSLQRRFRRAGV